MKFSTDTTSTTTTTVQLSRNEWHNPETAGLTKLASWAVYGHRVCAKYIRVKTFNLFKNLLVEISAIWNSPTVARKEPGLARWTLSGTPDQIKLNQIQCSETNIFIIRLSLHEINYRLHFGHEDTLTQNIILKFYQADIGAGTYLKRNLRHGYEDVFPDSHNALVLNDVPFLWTHDKSQPINPEKLGRLSPSFRSQCKIAGCRLHRYNHFKDTRNIISV